MTQLIKTLPLGICLAICVSLVASYSADWMGEAMFGFEKSPVSPIMLAILIGMLIANTLRIPSSIQPGLAFCSNKVLRLGIMLLGIRLSLLEAGKFTLIALPFVLIAVSVGMAMVGSLSRKLGLSRQLGGLIAIGTSICGATAIVATAPLLRAKESEVSYAIACVTVFGIAAMLLYPSLAHLAFETQPELAGLFLGTSIHETAQVAGAGLIYQSQFDAPVALDTATVTKLVRNLSMIALIPLVAILFGEQRSRPESRGAAYYLSMIPWFIVGFALFSALRTIGDQGALAFGFMQVETWRDTVDFLRAGAESCLLVAMAAVGLSSSFAGMKAIGLRPFALGFFVAALIGVASFLAISLFAPMLIKLLS